MTTISIFKIDPKDVKTSLSLGRELAFEKEMLPGSRHGIWNNKNIRTVIVDEDGKLEIPLEPMIPDTFSLLRLADMIGTDIALYWVDSSLMRGVGIVFLIMPEPV